MRRPALLAAARLVRRRPAAATLAAPNLAAAARRPAPPRPTTLPARRAYTAPSREYPALEVSITGKVRPRSVSSQEMVSEWRLPARDLLQLGLGDDDAADVASDGRFMTPPCVLPRGDAVLLRLGHLKVVCMRETLLVFDSHLPSVNASVLSLSHALRRLERGDAPPPPPPPGEGSGAGAPGSDDGFLFDAATREASLAARGKTRPGLLGHTDAMQRARANFKAGPNRRGAAQAFPARPSRAAGPPRPSDEHFELPLFVLENMLAELCESFARRARLYRPLVDVLLEKINRLDSESDALLGLHRLIPLTDGLSSFGLAVEEVSDVVRNLLSDDEDMTHLQLAMRESARRRGVLVDTDQHDAVELLLESYHRRLLRVRHELHHMSRRVKNSKELASIHIDLVRNHIVRTDLNLAMVGVGLSACTAVAGIFGMNLLSGLEEAPGLFGTVAASSMCGGALVYFAALRGSRRRGLGVNGGGGGGGNPDAITLAGQRGLTSASPAFDDVESLRFVFAHMATIEHAFSRTLAADGHVERQRFHALLCEEVGDPELPSAIVDLVFDLFDTSNDGLISEVEIVESTRRRKKKRRGGAV